MPLILAPRNSLGAAAASVPPARLDHGELVVGRGAGAGLLLTSPLVSRRHCVIAVDRAGYRLTDTSSGGTFLNGQRITQPQLLRNGDVIRVGDIDLAVSIEAAASRASAASHDSWNRPATGSAGGGLATQLPHAHPTLPAADANDPLGSFLQSAGIARGGLGAGDQQVLAAAGAMLQASLTGLMRLLEERNKACGDLGIERQEADGAAIHQAGSPGELLVWLLSLPANQAAEQVSRACQELAAHQRASLGAMQASFRHALDQFAPEAIQLRTRDDADAWKAYQRAFADKDGFVEVFAQELAKQYADTARGSKD